MNVASLELCKELYELSGWEADNVIWGELLPNERGFKRPIIAYEYDLGYLLRKLPKACTDLYVGKTDYKARYFKGGYDRISITMNAVTPENALCQLAIELFKQGILRKDGKGNG